MQIVELDLDHFEFYCPVTGIKMMGDAEEFVASPATVFCFVDEVRDFECVTDDFRQAYESASADEDLLSEEVFQSLAGYGDRNLVCFTITTRGMACGPISSTVRVGINMNYTADEN